LGKTLFLKIVFKFEIVSLIFFYYLLRSCNGDRRRILDIKHPGLCTAVLAEPRATSTLDCFNSTVADSVRIIFNVPELGPGGGGGRGLEVAFTADENFDFFQKCLGSLRIFTNLERNFQQHVGDCHYGFMCATS
jgi:hypothetical protein